MSESVAESLSPAELLSSPTHRHWCVSALAVRARSTLHDLIITPTNCKCFLFLMLAWLTQPTEKKHTSTQWLEDLFLKYALTEFWKFQAYDPLKLFGVNSRCNHGQWSHLLEESHRSWCVITVTDKISWHNVAIYIFTSHAKHHFCIAKCLITRKAIDNCQNYIVSPLVIPSLKKYNNFCFESLMVSVDLD